METIVNKVILYRMDWCFWHHCKETYVFGKLTKRNGQKVIQIARSGYSSTEQNNIEACVPPWYHMHKSSLSHIEWPALSGCMYIYLMFNKGTFFNNVQSLACYILWTILPSFFLPILNSLYIEWYALSGYDYTM